MVSTIIHSPYYTRMLYIDEYLYTIGNDCIRCTNKTCVISRFVLCVYDSGEFFFTHSSECYIVYYISIFMPTGLTLVDENQNRFALGRGKFEEEKKKSNRRPVGTEHWPARGVISSERRSTGDENDA